MTALIRLVDFSLPLANPVLKFLIILIIILVAPIILNKIKIPHILGLIVAGAVIGPNGLNLLLRDSGIILSGTAGLLYIMFLAGLEIDIADFKRNSLKSFVFGMYTFLFPMIFGILAGVYLLKFSIPTAVLLASMFASHTLIVYPMLSRLGVAKNRAVNITVGGTLITDTLALLVLAVIVGMEKGEVNSEFWTKLTLSMLVFGLIVLLIFPLIARWFLKRYDDNVLQFIFVLAMVFLGAFLAELAGIEAIIGAFLSGLALSPLIPSTSALMNRISFVGNAVFIPFFLIGVGMLVDYKTFFEDQDTLIVAAIMTIVATGSKFIAALLTQKTFGFTIDERRLIFGLSNAQAAATLAAVLVGYNVIIGETPSGEPVRLLNESILNGTIVMILITCTIASFIAQKGGQNISLAESVTADRDENMERILIPVSNGETLEELINLSLIIKSGQNKKSLFALNVIPEDSPDPEFEIKGKRLLEKAASTASSADILLNTILTHDANIGNGIAKAVRENGITDMIMGIHIKEGISDDFLGSLIEGILSKCNITIFVYKSVQPVSTLKRHIIIVPENAEDEIGFPFWLSKIWNISRNTGTKLVFYATAKTNTVIKDILSHFTVKAEFKDFEDWNDFLIVARDVKLDDNLLIVLSREKKLSYHSAMKNIPAYLNKYFRSTSYILVYPMQAGVNDTETIDFNNPSLLEPIEKLDEFGKTIARLFRKK